MSKKWKKPGHNRKSSEHDSKPSTECKYSPPSVYAVSIQRDPEDEKRYTEEKNSRSSQKTIGTVLNWFTGIAAAAAIFYGGVAYEQWSDAHNNFRLDERAWINVSPGFPGFIKPNEAPVATLTLTNNGKTVAFDVAGNYYVEVVPNGQEPHFDSEIKHIQSRNGIVSPNGTVQIQAIRLKADGSGDLLTDTEKSDLESGKAWIAVHGSVWYKDVFRTQHWTKFCSWNGFRPGWDYSSRTCVTHNNVDSQ